LMIMDKLSEICKVKLQHVAKQKARISPSDLDDIIRSEISIPRGFLRALRDKYNEGNFGLIAEVKKASPSKGLIRADFAPERIAVEYAEGGAACLSVLTDIPYFQGSDEYLKVARAAVALPVLRKDFMLDAYQIIESRALGADCILLIMAALSDGQAAELEAAAFSFDMDVLVEVHDSNEAERALKHLKSTMIGVNNRSLKTLGVDLATSKALAGIIPSNYLKVCESGISTNADLIEMKRYGYNSFLVGESLMRQPDVVEATKRLLEND
jgi:indole-3-glycerol phosphate synthase